MKDLIRRIIKEEISNQGKEKLNKMIKKFGVINTSKVVGGLDNLLKIMGINSPMDFLHLFDDLDVVQSEEEPDFVLFRYKPKHNLMIYNRKNEYIYIDYSDIWSVLGDKFRLNYTEIQNPIMVWLDEVHNLRGVTPPLRIRSNKSSWMRSTI